MSDDAAVAEKYTWRQRLANRLHMWAERLYDDFHTVELTNKHDGTRVTLSCHWQWTGSWEDDYEFNCSCEDESLK